MPSPAAPSIPSGNLLRRFRRNRSASAAVEFALVAPVFFALLFAIIEVALMFFASQVLETMTQQSARTILTGQAQHHSPPYTNATFITNVICQQIPAIFNCASISVDVKSYSTFSSVTFPNQIDINGNFISNNLNYLPGNPGDIVVVRVFYPWQLFVTRFGFNISNMANSQRLLVATATFVNEPYQ